jgi:hypothetical protein
MKTPTEPIAKSEEAEARGRNLTRYRFFALTVLAALVTMAGISMWRMRSLDDLPDVGDPFDVAQAVRPISVRDEDNAYVSYIAARRKLTMLTLATDRLMRKTNTWSSADQKVRDYLEQNRPALEIWREGTERREALYHQAGETATDTTLPMAQHLRTFSQLAGLEGSRLEEQGAMEEAWSWYRAMLRASRHLGRHAVLIERQMGAYDHEQAARRIIHWAAEPRVNAFLLRRALNDALVADALTKPMSESMKLDYVVCLRELEEQRQALGEIPLPGGPNGWFDKAVTAAGVRNHVQRARLRATNDVERSRRVLRLLYANWLAQVDRPAAERAPIAIQKPNVIFAAGPSAPPAASAIAPQDLKAAIDQTLLAACFFRPLSSNTSSQDVWSEWYWQPNTLLAREPRRRAVLIVKLAAELYRREQGKPPANVGALLEGYLRQLPQGIGRDERIPDGID